MSGHPCPPSWLRNGGFVPMRLLFIAEQHQANLLLPVLERDGMSADVVDTLEKADFRLQTRTYEAVLFEQRPGRAADVSFLPRWRREGVQALAVILLPRSSGARD